MREKEFLPLVSERLGIDKINAMQAKMLEQATGQRDIILLSPTGSGKTLAFTLPVMRMLRPSTGRVQSVVIAPSRELVIQIASVVREIARGFKVTALYGGHNVEDEVNTLSVTPDIIVATPGRLLDHLRRRNVDAMPTRMLVLDEFDKSLELGFEEEMRKITGRLKNVSRVILTSATDLPVLPEFLKLDNPVKLDYLEANADLRSRLRVHRVDSVGRDKLASLLALLHTLASREGMQRTIIFVNHRESAERVADFLMRNEVDCALYHGALEQRDREKALSMFNNGSRPVLVATDLAARGLDIERVGRIIHYHLPLTPETYTHRNGRSARVEEEGDVYLLVGPDEQLKPFMEADDTVETDSSAEANLRSNLSTLWISAGKKEKLSRGDIVGFLVKEGGLEASAIGKINVFDHYSLVAVPCKGVKRLVELLSTKKIKGEKRKITLAGR
ncbi:MAG: DEAD/DEAH box helicase [Muribaculaceae bacterium]|nr:DEAD/DEAH box helicase [Muribaculaceae bacterium]